MLLFFDYSIFDLTLWKLKMIDLPKLRLFASISTFIALTHVMDCSSLFLARVSWVWSAVAFAYPHKVGAAFTVFLFLQSFLNAGHLQRLFIVQQYLHLGMGYFIFWVLFVSPQVCFVFFIILNSLLSLVVLSTAFCSLCFYFFANLSHGQVLFY